MRVVLGTEWHTIERHLGEIARELDDPDVAPMLTRTTTLYITSELELAPFVAAMQRARELTLQHASAASGAEPCSPLGYWFSALESLVTR